MKILSFTFNPYSEHCYVACSGELCVIIDPGCLGTEQTGELLAALMREKLTPAAILLTHAHFDHIYGVQALEDRFGLPVYLGRGEESVLDLNEEICSFSGMPRPQTGWSWKSVSDQDVLDFGGELRFEVIATPGHTPGGVSYYCREAQVIFSGDTLFAGSIGRTDLPGGDYDKEIVSIMEKLIWLDGGTLICPGHGPQSTIARERMTNPFLEPFNEREEMPEFP